MMWQISIVKIDYCSTELFQALVEGHVKELQFKSYFDHKLHVGTWEILQLGPCTLHLLNAPSPSLSAIEECIFCKMRLESSPVLKSRLFIIISKRKIYG